MPASPKFRSSGLATPGDMGSLTEEVGGLAKSFDLPSVDVVGVDEGA
jgi:hypothetical protein